MCVYGRVFNFLFISSLYLSPNFNFIKRWITQQLYYIIYQSSWIISRRIIATNLTGYLYFWIASSPWQQACPHDAICHCQCMVTLYIAQHTCTNSTLRTLYSLWGRYTLSASSPRFLHYFYSTLYLIISTIYHQASDLLYHCYFTQTSILFMYMASNLSVILLVCLLSTIVSFHQLLWVCQSQKSSFSQTPEAGASKNL